MKVYNVEQRTPEWKALHLGRPTASNFHRIVTPVKGDLSKQARGYAYQLVAETLLGRELDKPRWTTPAMERGIRLEPDAIQHYCFSNDAEIQKIGFVTTDDGRVGCSPDGFISGTRGGLEIKCPEDDNHIGIYIDGAGDEYKCQVQGSLAVAELEFWDLHVYHPELPSFTRRTHRDELYIAKLNAALREFLDIRDAMLAKARASGFFEERAALAMAA